MRGYLEILRSPAGRLICISGIARLGWGIEGLALVFQVEDAAGSFAAAGLAVGALGLTSAVLAPARGLLIDRRGRAAMLALSLIEAGVIAAIALTPAAGPEALSYILLAGLGGAVAPPFTAWTRAGLARRLDGERLRHAYTVDNIFEESAFVFGPLIGGLLIAVASPAVALGLVAVLTGGGGLALTLGRRAREWAPPLRARRPGGPRSLNRALALAFACMAAMGAGVGLFEVGVAAFADSEGSRAGAGVLFAALSVGGICGALIYGSRSWRGSTERQYALLLAALGSGLAALALPESLAALAAVTVVAGLAFTPVFIANSLLIEKLSPSGPAAVAFAWVTTAMNLGIAIGAATAGAIVDRHGTDPAFVTAGVVVLAASAAALALEPPFGLRHRVRES